VAGPSTPTRVIYAKLTSTGAYDVVAKTKTIDLPAARELAELMQLGNLPFGVHIEEELGYARPSGGGHVIARYTTYGWNDGRPAPPMTDLLWVDDVTFERVGRNPFALIPHSDAVFAELTELDAVKVPTVDPPRELARLRALGAAGATDFTNFVAGVLASDSLLMVGAQNQAANLERLMLLLPPRLRDRITFQTCAYQAPQLRRRVTVADAMHANLRQAAWSRVLPDDADSLTLNPAQRFSEFLSAPEQMQRAHELYEKLGESVAEGEGVLAAEATRLVRLADFLTALDRKLITEAVRLMGKATEAEASIELAEIEARFPPAAVAEAMVAVFESGSDDQALARALSVARGDASARYHDTLCDAVLTARREGHPALVTLLLRYAARASDADRAIRLHAALRPAAIAGTAFTVTDFPGPIASYLEVHLAGNRWRPLVAATSLIRAAGELYDLLRTREARSQVEHGCAAAIDDALRAITLTAMDVRDLRALQEALDAIAHDWSGRFAVALLTDAYLKRVNPTDLKEQAERLAGSASADCVGALCAALLAHIADTNDGELRVRMAAAAQALLGAHKDRQLGVRIAALLDQLGVHDNDLLEQPAFAAVLPLLGDTAREAALAQALGHALNRMLVDNGASGRAAVAELAAAVYEARASQQTIAVGSRALAAVLSSLRAARESGALAQHPLQIELALDLLAFAADPTAFRQIETTALGRSDAIAVRLRRLDRAIAQSVTAQDEHLYSALADALETVPGPLDAGARQRLRQALGTTGMHRRVLEAFNSVIQRPAS
jgi:hypothetical protein